MKKEPVLSQTSFTVEGGEKFFLSLVDAMYGIDRLRIFIKSHYHYYDDGLVREEKVNKNAFVSRISKWQIGFHVEVEGEKDIKKEVFFSVAIPFRGVSYSVSKIAADALNVEIKKFWVARHSASGIRVNKTHQSDVNQLYPKEWLVSDKKAKEFWDSEKREHSFEHAQYRASDFYTNCILYKNKLAFFITDWGIPVSEKALRAWASSGF